MQDRKKKKEKEKKKNHKLLNRGIESGNKLQRQVL